MTATPDYNRLLKHFQLLSRSYTFSRQFFAETARIEKAARRGNDGERLAALRQNPDYARAFDDEQPLISVIIPTYNRSHIVAERTVPSVIAQTYSNWEVIIIGDQMSEEHAERLASIDHPRVHFHNLKRRGRYPQEKGPLWYVAGIKPMNFGLRIARGQWIAHLDDDDEFLPDHLERLLATARTQRAEWAHSQVRFVDDDGHEAGVVGAPEPREGGIARISSIYHGMLKTFRYNQGCWKYLSPGDWDLWDRFLAMGVLHAHLPAITAIHHGGLNRVGEATSIPQADRPPLEQGIADYQAGRQQAAIDQLSKALEQDPENPLPYTYLAFICAEQGLTDDADAFITQASALAPTRHDLRAALGEVFLKAGQPAAASKHIEAALQGQPDLFMAYPALAEAWRQLDERERATLLLTSAASIDSPARDAIRTGLIELQTEQGDLASLAETCIRSRDNPLLHSLGIRQLCRCGGDPQRIAEETAWHASNFLRAPEVPPPAHKAPGERLNIAFLISDFEREAQLGRLEALLLHLPPTIFRTQVIDNDVASNTSEMAQRCSLLADCWDIIREQDDATALYTVADRAPDILIDFDGHGPRQRLALLHSAPARLKASWASGSPAPTEKIATLPGSAFNDSAHLRLPDGGELFMLPDYPVDSASPSITFGCLHPAIQVDATSWQLFAELLASLQDSRLRINLDRLGEPARRYICYLFSEQGVNAERLEFVHAAGSEALCKAWRPVGVALLPLYGSSELPLNCALWMDKPVVAAAGSAPWSDRPAALLQTLGYATQVVHDRAAYLDLARRLAADPRPAGTRQAIIRAGLTDSVSFASKVGEALVQSYFGNAA